jgi:hypothetical protein
MGGKTFKFATVTQTGKTFTERPRAHFPAPVCVSDLDRVVGLD